MAETLESLTNVVCTSSECYPSSTVTSDETQCDGDYTSDSSDSENECTSSSGEEMPPEPKISKRSASNILTKSHQGRSKTRLDLSKKYSWLILDGRGKGGYCKFCQKYYSGRKGLPKGSNGVFINKPFSK